MNVFVLDENPVLAATYHGDRHVVKMPTESAQILSSALYYHHILDENLYRVTHAHHPCVKFSSKDKKYFEWILSLGLSLCDEYYHRYGQFKDKRHGAEKILFYIKNQNYSELIPETNNTMNSWPRAMPDIFQTKGIVQSYRNLYLGDKEIGGKIHLAKYKNRDTPYWLLDKNT